MTCDLARFAMLVRRRAQRVVISRRVYRDPVAAARIVGGTGSADPDGGAEDRHEVLR